VPLAAAQLTGWQRAGVEPPAPVPLVPLVPLVPPGPTAPAPARS